MALVAGSIIGIGIGVPMLGTDPLKAVVGADCLYPDVWVPMGEDAAVWKQCIDQLLPYPVTTGLMQATGQPPRRFMHGLPAFHGLDTAVGRELHADHGLSVFGLTDPVFEADPAIVLPPAENRLHTIKAVLVVTLG